jgi:OmpA-OmpF porin, OOP family
VTAGPPQQGGKALVFNQRENTMNKQIFAALAALALSAGASAQGYGVISVGTARLNLDCSGATTCDKSDTAYKLIGGYKFSPNLAGEIGYFNFGKAKASDAVTRAEISNTAFGGGIAFHQDLSPDWNFVARLGLAQVKTKISGSIVGLGSGSDSDNNTSLYGGLGVGYKISKTVSLDAAWDFSKSKYNKNGADESGNINVFSLGVSFWF